MLNCTTRNEASYPTKAGELHCMPATTSNVGIFTASGCKQLTCPSFFFCESTVLSSPGNMRSYDLVVGAVRPCWALFQAMTSSHGPGIHLCLDFGRSGPGAKAGRAHSSTEGELLADRLRKDLRTRHGHEVGDAPHGQVPAWRQRSELLEHPYRPGVEDGQSIQGELELLAA